MAIFFRISEAKTRCISIVLHLRRTIWNLSDVTRVVFEICISSHANLMNQAIDQTARDNIDKQLITCGLDVQNKERINLTEKIGIAVREYLFRNPTLEHLSLLEGRIVRATAFSVFQRENHQRKLNCVKNQQQRSEKYWSFRVVP